VVDIRLQKEKLGRKRRMAWDGLLVERGNRRKSMGWKIKEEG